MLRRDWSLSRHRAYAAQVRWLQGRDPAFGLRARRSVNKGRALRAFSREGVYRGRSIRPLSRSHQPPDFVRRQNPKGLPKATRTSLVTPRPLDGAKRGACRAAPLAIEEGGLGPALRGAESNQEG